MRMGLMERVRRVAAARPRRLVLAEAADERIVRAAVKLAREKYAEVALVGDPEVARATARRADVQLGQVTLLDAADPESIAGTRAALSAVRGDRLAGAELERCAADPVYQAAWRVRDGLADCYVAGAVRTTAEVLRPALWLIGLAPGVKSVSSFFLMILPPGSPLAGARERVVTFADCAVLPDPTSEQLAEIACLAADHHERLTQEVPHVALLSFSTRGSAKHPAVDKVREATRIAREQRPDLHIDGELQVDAALIPDVGQRKCPDSVVAGHANVLVFPTLDAGNIGYKLVQRTAGAAALGPMLQGLRRQANDLSRGCTSEEVVDIATIACVMGAESTTAAR